MGSRLPRRPELADLELDSRADLFGPLLLQTGAPFDTVVAFEKKATPREHGRVRRPTRPRVPCSTHEE